MDDSRTTSSGDGMITQIRRLIAETRKRDLNEADTRHRIIDFVVHDVLAWPRNRTSLEQHHQSGYSDYILSKSNGDPILVIEAKRDGKYFSLPTPYVGEETHCYIPLSKLLTDSNIKSAIDQVRRYCFDNGGDYACITNGNEWIIFKPFERSKKWDSLNAFVVRSLKYFELNYTNAYNALSYSAIVDRSSLSSLLSSHQYKDKPLFYPKSKIVEHQYQINSNRLAGTLRPLINYYFGVISDSDHEFMDRCYVSQREYESTTVGMRNIIEDSLSPYFREYGVQQLEDTGKGGRLGGRITKNLKNSRSGEVLVLFGGKGSGKSTFIKRLLFHKPPRWLAENARVAIIDLLQTPQQEAVIRAAIWDKIVEKLDEKELLSEARDKLTDGLFKDRFVVAEKQELAGLAKDSETYNLKLNDLISRWKSDKIYCASRLVADLASSSKGAVIVIDNTDQFPEILQDFCFTSAQEVSKILGCTVVISMREERFYHSKIHGLLDAFQNQGFHISSPKPSEVFKRRLSYTIGLLRSERGRKKVLGEVDTATVEDCLVFLGILLKEFSSENSPLNSFLSACAHGDIRLSLDLFRSFMLSGYTNVDEMVANMNWNFQIHQVLKPVMTPARYFYDENTSEIPNIFQVRSARHGSHFTAMRILRRLRKAMAGSSPAYVSISELLSYFSDQFGMSEDFEFNMSILLKHGFAEANNRIDFYSPDVDKVKITNYGIYMFDSLAFYFTYIDLICTDCGMFDESSCNYLIEAARKEFSLFTKRQKIDRINVRLDRVGSFIDYLEKEEMREREEYALGMPLEETFSHKIKSTFAVEKTRVLKSAMRQKR